MKIPERGTALTQGRWIRTPNNYTMKPAVCIVCKSSLERDHEVLVDEGKREQEPIFMCSSGLRCNDRAWKGNLNARAKVRPGHARLRRRFRIRSTKLAAQASSG